MKFTNRHVSIGVLLIALLAGLFKLIDYKVKEPSCVFDDRKDGSELVFTDHARCRMGCRFVKQSMVEKVYEEGTVNCHKSGVKNGDMRYALELHDKTGDVIRVIVEDEENTHIVITVIRVNVGDNCQCG